jgi:hypothetical protein
MKLKFNASETDTIVKKVSNYTKPGNAYILEIKKAVKHRSLNQNRFYWGVVIPLFSQQSGYTKEEAHQTLSEIHLKYERGGRSFVRSTTSLSTIEFEQYVEQCRVFMWHEMNIRVPLPNEISDEFLITLDNIYNY